MPRWTVANHSEPQSLGGCSKTDARASSRNFQTQQALASLSNHLRSAVSVHARPSGWSCAAVTTLRAKPKGAKTSLSTTAQGSAVVCGDNVGGKLITGNPSSTLPPLTTNNQLFFSLFFGSLSRASPSRAKTRQAPPKKWNVRSQKVRSVPVERS